MHVLNADVLAKHGKEAHARNAAFLEEAGFNAYRLGLTSFDAPYKAGTPQLRSWLAGYQRAKSTGAKPMQVSAPNAFRRKAGK